MSKVLMKPCIVLTHRDLERIYDAALQGYKDKHLHGIDTQLQMVAQVLQAFADKFDTCLELQLPARLTHDPIDSL